MYALKLQVPGFLEIGEETITVVERYNTASEFWVILKAAEKWIEAYLFGFLALHVVLFSFGKSMISLFLGI